jgi:hypothetical protein
MNLAQRVVILIGLLAIAALAMVPPWGATFEQAMVETDKDYWAPADLSSGHMSAGHHLLTAPPTLGQVELKPSADGLGWQATVTGSHLDLPRLLLEWVAVATVTAGLAVLLGCRRRRQPDAGAGA